jgi:threonine aldolase
MNHLDPQAVRRRSAKFLSYDHPVTARQVLQELASYAEPDLLPDDYGKGELHQRFAGRVTELLGKPSAVFVPTGRLAQLITLKLWCDRRGVPTVAMHPRCHLEEYENKAYQHVFALKAAMAGGYNRITTLGDLQAIREPLGMIHLEIPLLSAGCRLPQWQELEAMSNWARERSIPIHADGARLWESLPYYGRSPAEIASLFDTVYVSFYKGLSAMSGAALAGPADFIDEVRLWQDRMGGNPPKLFPAVLDALRMLDRRLPLMGAFHEKACSLARGFSALPGVWIAPDPPHTNTFLVTLDGDPSRLEQAATAASAETGLWMVDFTRETGIPGVSQFQVVVGTAALDVSDDEAVTTLTRLLELLRGSAGPPRKVASTPERRA